MRRSKILIGTVFILLSLALALGGVCGPGAVPGAEEALSPVALGLCPAHTGECQVLRSAVGLDGLPTWWHVDGSRTKRFTLRGGDGDSEVFPAFVTLPPGS